MLFTKTGTSREKVIGVGCLFGKRQRWKKIGIKMGGENCKHGKVEGYGDKRAKL